MADYFAACLLMPKRVVKRLWCSGYQDLPSLAARLQVSVPALTVTPPAGARAVPLSQQLAAARAVHPAGDLIAATAGGAKKAPKA